MSLALRATAKRKRVEGDENAVPAKPFLQRGAGAAGAKGAIPAKAAVSSAKVTAPSSKSAASSAAALRSPLAPRGQSGAVGASAASSSAAPAGSRSVRKPAAGAGSSSGSFGIPSIADHLRSIFEKAEAENESFKNGYAKVIAKAQMPPKKFNEDFKSHNEKIKQAFEDCRAAIADAVQRRNEAIAAGKSLEDDINAKFAEANKLGGRLDDVTSAKAASDAELSRVRAELAETEAALETATANENAANAEIEEANEVLRQMEEAVAERNDQIEKLKADLLDYDAINKGLEDDKDELTHQLKSLRSQLDSAVNGSRSEVERIKSAQSEATADAHKKIAVLTSERDRLAAELQANQARIKDLERQADMGEINAAKLRSERDAAVEQRQALAAEADRMRVALDSKENAMAGFMTNFNKTQDMLFAREREAASQVSGLQDRLASLGRERDELKAFETSLRADLRESTAREARINAELATITASNADLSRQLQSTRADLTRVSSELESAKSALEVAEDKLAVVEGRLSEASNKVSNLEAESSLWQEKAKLWGDEKAHLTESKSRAEENNVRLNQEVETIRKLLTTSEGSKDQQLVGASNEIMELKFQVKRMERLEKELAAAKAQQLALKETLFGSEMQRRALHNQVQELKGNIRVYIRVRPFLPADQDPEAARAMAGLTEDDDAAAEFTADPTPAINVQADGTSLEIAPPAPRSTKDGFGLAKREQKPVKFGFDHIFGQRCGQEDVFNEVCHLVQSALDGYNVCLFSYGQTGSGKTHTMQGESSGAEAGLIPRSVKKIIDTAAEMSTHGWKYTIEASFLEIYNESIRDLLRVSKPSAAGAGAGSSKDTEPTNLTVHQDTDGNIDVPGLTKVRVETPSEIDNLMARAAKKRAVAVTNMNAQSSRSHSVFTLYVRGCHEAKGIAVTGTLNLCDLAGSERLSRSGAEGDRKKETAAINKSLSCLADVFKALSQKKPHVPFRNSKLTHLLQNCFRGDGKTLMLVNLSPTVASAQESLCSLRFAAQVSQVELGKPKKRVVESIADAPASSSSAAGSTSSTAWATRGAGATGSTAFSGTFASAGPSGGASMDGLDESCASSLHVEDLDNAGAAGGNSNRDDMDNADGDDGLEEESDMHGLDTSCLSINAGPSMPTAADGAGVKRQAGFSSSAVGPTSKAVSATAAGTKRPAAAMGSAAANPNRVGTSSMIALGKQSSSTTLASRKPGVPSATSASSAAAAANTGAKKPRMMNGK